MTPLIAAIIWFAGIIAWTAIRIPHQRRARKTPVVSHRRSAGERIALGLCTIGLVVIPAVAILTDWLDVADYLFHPVQGWLGAAVMIAFVLLFYVTHAQLARNWSVTLEMRENHKLVDTGLYAYMRHPMYTSFWLWGFAQLLLIPNLIAGPAGLLSVAWLYWSRIGKEEAMLRAHFGADYDAYCARTPRLIPLLFGRKKKS